MGRGAWRKSYCQSQGLTAEGQFLAREALNLWADILGISFVEVSESAQITFDDEDDGATLVLQLAMAS